MRFQEFNTERPHEALAMSCPAESTQCPPEPTADCPTSRTRSTIHSATNPTAAWRRVPADWRGGQGFCGILAACFHQNMGVLNIRIWAGGVLASSLRPDGVFIMTSGTDLGNEMRCGAAVRAAFGNGHGTSAQAALRFVLGNRDFSSRVIGINKIEQLYEATEAVKLGPLPSGATARLETMWANSFGTD